MKIGFICKYPPTAGGEAAKAYWLTRAMAERGHSIHVITNGNEVESTYCERMMPEDYNYCNIPNLKVYPTPRGGLPGYIPQGNPFEIKLASIGLKVAGEEGLELIDSWYLVPNAVAAFMVINAFERKIPWVVRHAGTDLGILLPHPLFEPLLKKILLKADKIITYRPCLSLFSKFRIPEEKFWFNDKVSVDTISFSPEGPIAEELPVDKPIIMSIGKIGPVKGTYDLLEAFVPFKNSAYLVFVTGGPGLEFLKIQIERLGLNDAVKIFPPVPPWKIPNYFRAATLAVFAERDFPIVFHYPISIREGLACGCCLLISEELFGKYRFLERGKNVLTVNPHDHEHFIAQIKFALDNPKMVEEMGMRARETALRVENFDDYVNTNIEFYSNMINKSDFSK
jgi:glycosyltransferase involved in cell wall biosynthesis